MKALPDGAAREAVAQQVGTPDSRTSARACCAAAVAAHQSKCPGCGRFLKGNTSSLKHGGRSARVQGGRLPEQAEVLAAMREHEVAIIADLGGADRVSTLKADMVRRYLALSNQAEWLEANLFRHGYLTTKGHTRAALTVYLQVVDRLARVTGALGLERQARQASINDWLAGRAAGASDAAAAGQVVAGGDSSDVSTSGR